jgi:hypothetical protein
MVLGLAIVKNGIKFVQLFALIILIKIGANTLL